jgi:hypothetical protein
MEVEVRYLTRDIAKYFRSANKREIIHLPNNAKYENLLNLLEEKYEPAPKSEQRGKMKQKMLDFFVFISEGASLLSIRNKTVNPNNKVLVAYADTGG